MILKPKITDTRLDLLELFSKCNGRLGVYQPTCIVWCCHSHKVDSNKFGSNMYINITRVLQLPILVISAAWLQITWSTQYKMYNRMPCSIADKWR